MQRYQCHKIVEAAKILALARLDDGVIQLELDDHEIIQLEEEGAYKLPAFAGPRVEGGDLGYFVRYAGGYESWSPTTAFEDGYEALIDKQVMVTFHRPPGHRGSLICGADASYIEVLRRVGDFLQRAFFGNDADGNPIYPKPHPEPAEEELTDGQV